MTKPILSAAAQSALLGAGCSRQGTPIPRTTPAVVVAELQRLGAIGQNRGLTRDGLIARERLVTAALNRAFGAI